MSDLARLGSGAMFDRIAGRYDTLNRIISLGIDRGWRKRTIRALDLKPGQRVLDLATGTGDLALELQRRHPNVDVVGVDPSPNMLSIFGDKIRKKQVEGRVRYQEGMAEALSFEDDAFDACMMAFGIRNVEDRDGALREMARVVRSGGRVAILELSEPQRGLLGPLARFHMRVVVPFLGALLSGQKEYRYLQRSIAAFPQPDAFASMMERSGLSVRSIVPLTFGVCCLYIAEVMQEPGAPDSAGQQRATGEAGVR